MTSHTHDHSATPADPEEFWEDLYRERGQRWSGKVNVTLEAEVVKTERLAGAHGAGRALDLGCGEGGDALWLAGRGWSVTAVDISQIALDRGAVQAEAVGLADKVEWVQADLATWTPCGEFDLISSCFMQSPVEFPREEVLRRAAGALASGGVLVVIGHGDLPPWSAHHGDENVSLPSPDEVLASLELQGDGWEVVTSELVGREAAGPNGETGHLLDSVLSVRRLA